jgi:hypothetical protein
MNSKLSNVSAYLSSQAHSWEGWALALGETDRDLAETLSIGRRRDSTAYATELYAGETMAPVAKSPSPNGEVQPYTLQWFLEI